jgi:hypothetical protein
MKTNVKVGQKIYVESAFHISNGSADVVGGLATVTEVKEDISAGKPALFVSVKEHPGTAYNWEILSEKQENLKNRFGTSKAHPDPDVDTPWIEDGDIVGGKINGKDYHGEVYHGKDIW